MFSPRADRTEMCSLALLADCFAGSSNGKTPASGAGYRGSSPCPAARSAASGRGLCRPVAVEPPVGALGGQQLLVRALLDDPAAVEHDDPPGAPDGREAVRETAPRAAGQQPPQPGLDARLGVDVDVRRRLVEHEDARIG